MTKNKKYLQLLTILCLSSDRCSFQQPRAESPTSPKKRTPFFDTTLADNWVSKIFWALELVKNVELNKKMQHICDIDSKNYRNCSLLYCIITSSFIY